MHLFPESWGSSRPLREYNTCHGPDGRFCSGSGGTSKAAILRKTGQPGVPAGEKISHAPSLGKNDVIQARTVEEAIEHILAGRDVELAKKRDVNTLLDRLGAMANEAKRLGQNAPTYDLCKVSVAGTNVFCTTGLKTKQYPNGIPRVEMPQMGGIPVPGSQADRLPKNDKGEVNGAEHFQAWLKAKGISVSAGSTPAARLKASQAELVGPKVAGMMTAQTYDPAKEPIFVSRDDYVIDGHHRWAATIGRDAADGRLGGHKMRTLRVDAPISRILRLANQWAKEFGIAPKAAGKGAKVG